MLNSALRFPCLTRGLPRRTVPEHASLTSLPAPLLQRWSSDSFRFSVGVYSNAYLLSDGVHQRTLCAAEKEVLLGFPRSHTRLAIKVVRTEFGEDARHCLLGNPLQCILVADLARMGLRAIGWESTFPLAADSSRLRNVHLVQLPCEKPPVSSGPTHEVYDSLEDTEMKFAHAAADLGITLAFEDHSSVSCLQHQTSLPHFFLPRAEYRGSDVRLDTGMLMHPEIRSINPHLWTWKPVLCWCWKHRAHINILELLACLKSFRWRARSKRFHRARVMHLWDSQYPWQFLSMGDPAP